METAKYGVYGPCGAVMHLLQPIRLRASHRDSALPFAGERIGAGGSEQEPTSEFL